MTASPVTVFEERPLVTPFQCRKCRAFSELRTRQCPACRGKYTLLPIGQEALRKQRAEITSSLDAIEADTPRVSTGWPTVDPLFGGGVVIGSTTLIWGAAGLGKTTFLLQLAARIAFERTLVVQSEQPLRSLMSTVKRLGIERRGFDIVSTDDLDEATHAIVRREYQFVVVDSLQMLVDTELDSLAGSIKQGRRVGRSLVKLAQRKSITMVIANHVLSSGRQAGGTYNVHGVDGTMVLEGDLADESGIRWVQCLKNRHGGSGRRARLRMGEKGLEEHPEEPKR